MELIKIKGNSYYINAPTNIGLYVFKNKACLIIDTGINNGQARRIDEILTENGLHPKYIVNTHSHLDHCGGNSYFKENYPGCIIYTSELEKLYLENPHLYPTILASSSPSKELYRKQRERSYKVDFTLDEGIVKINDVKFEIVSLTGHSIGQIGLITPEKVCFMGDALFSRETMDKYGLPYLYDLEETIGTLNRIKELEWDYYVLGHSEEHLDRSAIQNLVKDNLENTDKYITQITTLLDQPHSREELLENLIILNDFQVNFTQYHLYQSSLSAFLTYLYNRDEIDYSLEDGKIYYYNSVK